MSRQRTVVLVPDPSEPADDYWRNFVWRVRDALTGVGDVRVIEAMPRHDDQGEEPRHAR